MRVAIRVDASTAMGLGHLKRCLSLGKALQAAGAMVCFVTRPLGLDSTARLGHQGLDVIELPAAAAAPKASMDTDPPHAAWAGVDTAQDAKETCAALLGQMARWDWIVVDSYAFDARWHLAVKASLGARVCVIDDLADRAIEADLLIDHNFSPDHQVKYARHVRAGVRILGGPRFALIDPAYENAVKHDVNAAVRSIGIFVGGTDPWNASSRAVRTCRGRAAFEGQIAIATTAANPHLAELHALCEQDRGTTLVVDESDLTNFFASHDLQIGAGGGAVWERCCIGAPTVAMVLAENHLASLDALSKAGAVRLAASPDDADLGAAVAELISDENERMQLSKRARELVDGRGATRVALAMLASSIDFRHAVQNDAQHIFTWRNAEITRRHFRDSSPLDLQSHIAWWRSSLDSPLRRLLIARCGSIEVGVLRLDCDRARTLAEVSLYLDPALHGLGLGAALLKSVKAWTARNEASVKRLVAEVLPGNKASQAAFRTAGFTQAADLHHWNLTVSR